MLDFYYRDVDNLIRYRHSRNSNLVDGDFHLHNWYELYFFIAGEVDYFVEKKVYPLKYGDLLVINSHEIHKPAFRLINTVYERIVISLDPAVPRLFNSPKFDLLNCFENRPIGERNKIILNDDQIRDLLKYFTELEKAFVNTGNGASIKKLTAFINLLVFINEVFLSIPPTDEHLHIPEKLVPLFDYIDKNLGSDLSLETLEKELFINRYYLSRLFKESTGSGIHEYIIFKRLSMAKRLLAEGYSVTDCCQLSGFKDLSNFITTFKRTVGVSPGQYKKKI